MRHLPLCLTLILLPAATRAQERLPQQVAGTWRITRILPVHPNTCWTPKQAQPLVGTLLRYTPTEMHWQGGTVPLSGITTRSVTADDLAREAPGGASPLQLADLGIHTRGGVLEVNLQHDDADITGATTEVPGDSVLVAGPGRIVISACGIYLEARKLPSTGAAPPASPPAHPRSAEAPKPPSHSYAS